VGPREAAQGLGGASRRERLGRMGGRKSGAVSERSGASVSEGSRPSRPSGASGSMFVGNSLGGFAKKNIGPCNSGRREYMNLVLWMLKLTKSEFITEPKTHAGCS
jgi:hypothetical protein